MKVRLIQNLHLGGGVREAGSVVEEEGGVCQSWIDRGIAVLDAAPIEPAVLAGFYESEGAFVEAIDEVIAALPEAAPEVAPEPSPVAPIIETKAQRKARERAARG